MVASIASFAEPFSNVCNENNSDGSVGMPMKSCTIDNLTNYTLIVNGSRFMIDTYQTVTYNGESFGLRLYVTNTVPEYNPIMALAQNAFATRAPLHIIYVNPAVTNIINADYLNNKNCGINRNNDGTPAYMHCPIQSFTIFSQN